MKRILILCVVLLCVVPLTSAMKLTPTTYGWENGCGAGTYQNVSRTLDGSTDTFTMPTDALQCMAYYDFGQVVTIQYASIYHNRWLWDSRPFKYSNTSAATQSWTGTAPEGEWFRLNSTIDLISLGSRGYLAANDGGQFNLSEIEFYGYPGTTPPPPTANFTASPLSGAAPLYVMFDDTSENESGTCTYNWTLIPASGISAGATGTLENHAASFSVPGNYTVSHGVSCDAGSNISTKTDYIAVYNATTDYITTHFVVMDEPRWVQLAGSTINMLDIENGTWKNVSPSATGYEGITTLSNHTISAYASMTGYGDDELLSQPAWSGGDYRLLLFPTGYGNVSAGNVTVYVSVYDSDVLANQGRVSGAAVNMAYSSGGDQVNDYRTTDSSGMVSFVVPNNTVIYLYAEKAGYTRGGTTINSGTGNGGSAAVYAEITLARTTVTTAPTVTTLPGGGTPAPTVDPYPCDADHPENCKRKQTEMGNTLIQWGPDLLLLFICATIIGTIKLMMK